MRTSCPRLAKQKLTFTFAAENYQQARKILKTVIRTSKRISWRKPGNQMDKNPFCKPYEVIIKKFRVSSITNRIELDALENMMKELLPEHPTPMIMHPKLVRTYPSYISRR